MQHYDDVINALVAAGIKPLVTLHHFSNPRWIADPTDLPCTYGPSNVNLCGLGDPGGAKTSSTRWRCSPPRWRRATAIASTSGARSTSRSIICSPPTAWRSSRPATATRSPTSRHFMNVVRDYLEAHARMYSAIKAADVIDADGDGVAASVGLSLSVAWFEAAQANAPSNDPTDVAARDRVEYVYHHLVPDSILNGTFDSDLDGNPDE